MEPTVEYIKKEVSPASGCDAKDARSFALLTDKIVIDWALMQI